MMMINLIISKVIEIAQMFHNHEVF